MINILMYHGFTDKEKHEGIINHHGKHLHVQKFEEQIQFLKSNYHILSLEEVADAYQNKKFPSKRSVVITVDDGYKSNYTLAYPILQKYKAPATFFITTDFVDQKKFLWVDRVEFAINRTLKAHLELNLNGQELSFDLSHRDARIKTDQRIKAILKRLTAHKRDHIVLRLEERLQESLSKISQQEMYDPLSWQDIRMMQQDDLITIGSHGCSHTILTNCSMEDLQHELSFSKKRIEEMTQKKCLYLSYPNGQNGDFNQTTKAALIKHSFKAGLTTIVGSNDLKDDYYELKRLNIHNQGDLAGFQRTLSPFFRFLRTIKNGSVFRSSLG